MIHMRVAIVGKNSARAASVQRMVQKKELISTTTDPDIVISYGGDGTFLVAERAYPGIPKLLIRDSHICNKCVNIPLQEALKKVVEGKFHITEHVKLAAHIPQKEDELVCTNDFVLRNIAPTHAIRFTLSLNEKLQQKGKAYIGDGVVIATPFGADAYYYSIVRKTFSKGIGIAFNNLHREQPHLNIAEDTKIKIKLTRGDAHFVADNDPTIHIIHEGENVFVKKSPHVARIINF